MAPAVGDAIATVDVGVSDYSMATTIDLSSGSGWGTTDGWEFGPVFRYQDPFNYVFARYLWQNGSPEIEIFEIRNGQGRLLNAKNITGLVTLGSTHVMRVSVVGSGRWSWPIVSMTTPSWSRSCPGSGNGCAAEP